MLKCVELLNISPQKRTWSLIHDQCGLFQGKQNVNNDWYMTSLKSTGFSINSRHSPSGKTFFSTWSDPLLSAEVKNPLTLALSSRAMTEPRSRHTATQLSLSLMSLCRIRSEHGNNWPENKLDVFKTQRHQRHLAAGDHRTAHAQTQPAETVLCLEQNQCILRILKLAH